MRAVWHPLPAISSPSLVERCKADEVAVSVSRPIAGGVPGSSRRGSVQIANTSRRPDATQQERQIVGVAIVGRAGGPKHRKHDEHRARS